MFWGWGQKKTLSGILLCLFSVSLCGCIYLVVGGVGALGGYVVSPDTVEGVMSGDFTEVWDRTLEVVSVMGVIQEQNEPGGIIIVNIQGNRVTLTLYSISNSMVKLSVKARKAFLPRIRVAQDVYVKIEKALYE
ncbi:MAG TPA: hypothetical protein PLT76_02925 [Candidatus Omnitrophota bacterium]|nr:hypothetical protein [Candidatus Omnitrophota bacterium]HPB68697.1 hypothetical protein [Candidatus Omnitrophota bacterium]HQO57660.1 hypothetical protein [Candidatus Omnitrophota bacterium]